MGIHPMHISLFLLPDVLLRLTVFFRGRSVSEGDVEFLNVEGTPVCLRPSLRKTSIYPREH